MNLRQNIKIALGLGLFTPLAAMALDINGKQVFTEEVNINKIDDSTENNSLLKSGIIINKNSEATFNENVNINLSETVNPSVGEADHISLTGLNIIDSNNNTNSRTIFEKDLVINVKGYHPSAISISPDHFSQNKADHGDIYVEVKGKTILNSFDDAGDDDYYSGYSIDMETGTLVLSGESWINNGIHVTGHNEDLTGLKTNLIIKNKSNIYGTIEAYDSGNINLDLAEGSKIQADLIAEDNGIINLKLASDSIFIGIADSRDQFFDSDIDDKAHPGFINIDLSKGALWNILDREVDEDEDQDFNSYITQLSGAGSVTFDHNTQTRSPSFKNLTVENLKGALTFTMSTDIVAEKSDKLIITKSAEGHHTLNLINNGSSKTTGQEKLTLVDINENATSTAEFKTDHQVELGGYKYHLTKDGNNWVLVSNGTVTNTDKNDNNTSSKPQITTTANASAGFLNANYLMSYVETQTLLKRLGDMRNSGTFGDVWLRGFSGKLDSFSSGKLSKFDMNYHGFQFGADKQLSENTPFVIGAFVGQTYGDPDYRKGDGSLRSFNTGLYTTYLDESGFYLDGVAKYARQKNHFKVRDTADNRVQGTGHTNGLGVSLELGKKYQINDFYIEPQTQIAYSHQNGTSINATNGLNVKLGNYNSLIGRASALFGYQVNTENSNINLYAKTGIVREFDGDTYYKLNGNKESHSFEGNWWNNSIGVSAQVNKAHTIYLDVESSTGNRFNLLQVNGGYRYSF
ncbi:hypothetical protein A9G09_00925 [Gilliamella sp. wkB292]|uniref:autotransporter outer membrane beta-barrel domain-containing protein n=1 Tax=unclassified Gilliamella TaxID=2685620 RepID=UPI00080E1B5D|nr:autotransporter outer membrane beta-barrel domain-containing protein [Gilliamella apicola]OCG11314.1 hypothetical protein A9G09_00925 [Gilliamella apicola]OCL19443.1 hypothetical protein A9G03_06895 [Gilliamella apicola]